MKPSWKIMQIEFSEKYCKQIKTRMKKFRLSLF